LLPYVPFASLSFRDAVAVHLAVSAALLAICALIWAWWSLQAREALPLLCCLASVPAWPPVLAVLGMGQNTVLVVASLTAAVACLRCGRNFLAGLTLTLMTVKPHLAITILAFFAAWALRQRRFALFVGLGCGLGLAVLKTFFIRPTLWAEYIAFLANSLPPMHYYSATLDGWGRFWLGEGFRIATQALWVCGVAAASLIGWRAHEVSLLPRAAALVACLALAAAPHAFSYDFVLLLPVYLAVIAAALERRGPGWGWRIAVVFTAVTLLALGKFDGWRELQFWTVPWLVLAPAAVMLFEVSGRQGLSSAPPADASGKAMNILPTSVR
jgi:hypothetical protein